MLANTTKKGHNWHFLEENSSKSNALQKGAPAAAFKRGQRFKWRIELSQNFKNDREKSLKEVCTYSRVGTLITISLRTTYVRIYLLQLNLSVLF